MPIFMLKCENCNSERQSQRLDTITCPDCGAERDFVRTEKDLEQPRNGVITADRTSPDLIALREKFFGKGSTTQESINSSGEKSDIVVRVKKPGAPHPLVVIIDSVTGDIIGEQG